MHLNQLSIKWIVLISGFFCLVILILNKIEIENNTLLNQSIRYEKKLLDKDERVKAIYFVNELGQFDSLYTTFYTSGDRRMELNFKNGVRQGRCVTYHFGDLIESIHYYKNGNVEGAFQWFHPNEELRQSGTKKNGRTEGLVKSFYEEGSLLSEVNWVAGIKSGESKEYYKDGLLKVYTYYDDYGKLAFQISYLVDGVIDNLIGIPIINLYASVNNYDETVNGTFNIANIPNDSLNLEVIRIDEFKKVYSVPVQKEAQNYRIKQQFSNWPNSVYQFYVLLKKEEKIQFRHKFLLRKEQVASITYQ